MYKEIPQLTFGGGGRASRLVCGYLNCDQRFSPLVEALPTMLLVRGRDDYSVIEAVDASGSPSDKRAAGVEKLVGHDAEVHHQRSHAARPGNAAMLGRLTELMFVEILREYMQRLPANQGGWLGGLNDPHVGKALRLVHANPARDWTVEELAREAAVSRSVLAQRFTELVGETPMRYLASWRMQLAKQMLREGARNIQEVATRVGYDSEAAFNRAFKRATGSPPATWRRGRSACPRYLPALDLVAMRLSVARSSDEMRRIPKRPPDASAIASPYLMMSSGVMSKRPPDSTRALIRLPRGGTHCPRVGDRASP